MAIAALAPLTAISSGAGQTLPNIRPSTIAWAAESSMSWPVTGIEPGFEPGAVDRLQHAERHAVVGHQEGVDLVGVLRQRVLGVGLGRLGLPFRRELIHDDLDVALLDEGIEDRVIAVLHLRRAGLPGVPADQDVAALRHRGDDGARGGGAALLRVAADEGGLLGAEDEIVVRGERDAGLRRHLRRWRRRR